MPPVRSRCLEDLDLFAAYGLAALVQSREVHRPVTPTKAMTIRLLEALQQRGIVALPWPEARWELPPRGYLAPLEQLGWDYGWAELPIGGLGHAIEQALDDRPRDEAHTEQVIQVWRALVRAECVEYFEFQLGKHGMDRSWSCDLDWLPRHYSDALSLARWKYLIWSAVRHGAMHCMGSGFDRSQTRDAVATTLSSPQRYGFAVGGQFDGFLPKHARPHSLMADRFVRLTQLGFSYWSQPPSLEGLEEHRASLRP
jgi:hypothetical protein